MDIDTSTTQPTPTITSSATTTRSAANSGNTNPQILNQGQTPGAGTTGLQPRTDSLHAPGESFQYWHQQIPYVRRYYYQTLHMRRPVHSTPAYLNSMHNWMHPCTSDMDLNTLFRSKAPAREITNKLKWSNRLTHHIPAMQTLSPAQPSTSTITTHSTDMMPLSQRFGMFCLDTCMSCISLYIIAAVVVYLRVWKRSDGTVLEWFEQY